MHHLEQPLAISKLEISKVKISKRLFGFQVSFFQVVAPSGASPNESAQKKTKNEGPTRPSP